MGIFEVVVGGRVRALWKGIVQGNTVGWFLKPLGPFNDPMRTL